MEIKKMRSPEKGFWLSEKVRNDDVFVAAIGPSVKDDKIVVVYRKDGRLFKGFAESVNNLKYSEIKTIEYDDSFYAAEDINGGFHLGCRKDGVLYDMFLLGNNNNEQVFISCLTDI